jgi:hypothetical protein
LGFKLCNAPFFTPGIKKKKKKKKKKKLLLNRESTFFFSSFLFFHIRMGQAASITLSDKSDIICDSEDFSRRFNKMALSTIKVPMVIVAFPLLNAYKFREHEFTGVKVIDGTIGGLLGVVGCKFLVKNNEKMILITPFSSGPLSPFVAFWSAYQSMFIEGPSKSTEITEETKMQVRRAMGMDCDRFYNVAIVGAAGTGKVRKKKQ